MKNKKIDWEKIYDAWDRLDFITKIGNDRITASEFLEFIYKVYGISYRNIYTSILERQDGYIEEGLETLHKELARKRNGLVD